MDAIERIQSMERALDEVSWAQRKLSQALEAFSSTEAALIALSDYYGSEAYRRDLESDEAGLLPEGLKRGVLSEDAVYDLLSDLREMAAEMQAVAKRTLDAISPSGDPSDPAD